MSRAESHYACTLLQGSSSDDWGREERRQGAVKQPLEEFAEILCDLLLEQQILSSAVAGASEWPLGAGNGDPGCINSCQSGGDGGVSACGIRQVYRIPTTSRAASTKNLAANMRAKSNLTPRSSHDECILIECSRSRIRVSFQFHVKQAEFKLPLMRFLTALHENVAAGPGGGGVKVSATPAATDKIGALWIGREVFAAERDTEERARAAEPDGPRVAGNALPTSLPYYRRSPPPPVSMGAVSEFFAAWEECVASTTHHAQQLVERQMLHYKMIRPTPVDGFHLTLLFTPEMSHKHSIKDLVNYAVQIVKKTEEAVVAAAARDFDCCSAIGATYFDAVRRQAEKALGAHETEAVTESNCDRTNESGSSRNRAWTSDSWYDLNGCRRDQSAASKRST